MSDNKIDELFKSGLNRPDNSIEFSEQEWGKLEERLDNHQKKKKALVWIGWSSGIAGAVAVIFLWFQLGSDQVQLNKTVENSSKHKTQQVAKGKSVQPETRSQSTPDINAASTRSLAKETKPTIGARDNFIAPFKPENDQFSSNSMINLHGMESVSEVVVSDTSKRNYSDQLKLNSINSISFASKEAKPVKKNPSFGNLTFSFSVAPSFNGVNSFKGAELGGDIGAMLSMDLNKKLSISTGVIYAKKVYSTGFENYNPTQPLPFAYSPTTIDADCRVLDIPLNLNYRVFNKGKNSISVGTGISSYIMLHETYDFNYDYNNPNDPQSYTVNNQNKHWFNVINVQMQYERKLSPNSSIGVQPYLKMPIEGVGYSKVKLQSVGVAINFNVDLSKKK